MSKTPLTSIFFLVQLTLVLNTSSNAQSGEASKITSIGPEAFAVMREFFNYDPEIPLEAHTVERLDEPGYIREKIVFRGIRDSFAPGYLAVPKSGTPPYPCVIQLHGIGGSKEGWWKEDAAHSGGKLTNQLLAAGFAVLALDAEYHGERLANNNYESPEVFTFQKGWLFRARDMVVQSVVEYRRAMDYLASRTEIDTARIGVIGYSMGGMMAFNLAAVDPRVKAAVACVTPILKESYSAMAVANYAPYIKTQPFLMLMGDADERNYTTEDAQRLHGAIASDAKELVIYESGHRLPGEWTEKAMAWMEEYLK